MCSEDVDGLEVKLGREDTDLFVGVVLGDVLPGEIHLDEGYAHSFSNRATAAPHRSAARTDDSGASAEGIIAAVAVVVIAGALATIQARRKRLRQ